MAADTLYSSDNQSRIVSYREVVACLPASSNTTFLYLMKFFVKLLAPENAASNGFSLETLTPVFASYILRKKTPKLAHEKAVHHDNVDARKDGAAISSLAFMLTNYADIFNKTNAEVVRQMTSENAKMKEKILENEKVISNMKALEDLNNNQKLKMVISMWQKNSKYQWFQQWKTYISRLTGK
jgi:hypothetical protein